MKRDAGWVAASVVAATAVFGASSLQTKTEPSAVRGEGHFLAEHHGASGGKANPARPRVDDPCKDIQDLLDHFLSVAEDAIGEPASCAAGTATPALGRTAKLRVVVATLPDPLHTHLSLVFDRGIEALQQGAQDEGYTYDSSWLPWETAEHTYPLFADQEAADDREDQREDQPGILLFRRQIDVNDKAAARDAGALSRPYEEGLLVFIVGDDATKGIHRAQFKEAAQWIDRLRSQHLLREATPQILAPAFSGSLPSLLESLRSPTVQQAFQPVPAQPAAGPCNAKPAGIEAVPAHMSNARCGVPASFPGSLDIFSGDVTQQAGAQWFQHQAKATLSPLQIRFHSFQHADRTLQDRFTGYLLRMGAKDLSHVAIISEDETAYGVTQPGVSNPQAPATFYYPRDISALRAAYQQQALFQAGPASSTDAARRTLHTDLVDPSGKADDTPQSYGGSQSALSQEAVLLQIVSQLHFHGAWYLLLRSTNPLDQLFLAHFFQSAYPEGRIVIVGNDLLLRREVGTGGLNGILTLDTYPLLPQSDDWTQRKPPLPGESHRVFTQQSAHGVYTALRFLLHENSLDPKATSKDTPADISADGQPIFTPPSSESAKFDLPLTDYAPPFWLGSATDGVVPDVWLSVLGNNGFWPVAALDSASSQRGCCRTPQPAADPARAAAFAPLSMKLALLGTLFWALFHLYCCAMPAATVKPVHRSYFARLRGSKTETVAGEHAKHVGLITAQSTLPPVAAFALSWACGRVSSTPTPTLITIPWWCSYMPWSVALICLAALMFNVRMEQKLATGTDEDVFPLPAIFGRPSRWRPRAWNTIRAAWRPALWYVACVAAFYLLFWLYLDGVLTPDIQVLTYVRAMNLTTGVSPVVPFLVLTAGLYGWCWNALGALSMFGPDKPRLPSNSAMEMGQPTAPLNYLTMLSSGFAGRKIEAACTPFGWRSVLTGGASVIVLAALAVSLAGGVPLRNLGTLRYPKFICIWLAITIGVLLANAFQLLSIWLRLRNMLAFLDKLPLRRTFFAMRGYTWNSIWKMGGNVLDTRYKLFYREFEAFNHLQAALNADAAGLGRTIQQADAKPWIARIEVNRALRKTFGEWYAKRWDRWSARDLSSLCKVQASTANIAGRLLGGLLVPAWAIEKNSLLTTSDMPSADTASESARIEALFQGVPLHIRRAEELVCLVYLGFIQNILGRIRALVIGMIWLFVSIALVLPSYPFDPRPVLTGTVVTLFVIIGTIVFMVYAQMFRDATLSHLTNTQPGELGASFWLKFISFAAGPLIGLVATLFPQFSGFFLSWLEPGLASLK